MEKIYQIFNARTKLAIGISVGVILVILIFILSFQKTSTSQIQVIPTSIPSPLSPTISTFEDIITPTPSEKTHLAAEYVMVYPSNWNEQNMTVAGGGTSFILMPRDKKEDEFFPRIDIEVTPLEPQDIIIKRAADLANIYKLSQSNVTFAGVAAIELDGTLNLQWVTGNPDQKPVHKTFLFFNQGSNSFVIEYAYFEDESTTKFSSIIDKILASFRYR